MHIGQRQAAEVRAEGLDNLLNVGAILLEVVTVDEAVPQGGTTTTDFLHNLLDSQDVIDEAELSITLLRGIQRLDDEGILDIGSIIDPQINQLFLLVQTRADSGCEGHSALNGVSDGETILDTGQRQVTTIVELLYDQLGHRVHHGHSDLLIGIRIDDIVVGAIRSTELIVQVVVVGSLNQLHGIHIGTHIAEIEAILTIGYQLLDSTLYDIGVVGIQDRIDLITINVVDDGIIAAIFIGQDRIIPAISIQHIAGERLGHLGTILLGLDGSVPEGTIGTIEKQITRSNLQIHTTIGVDNDAVHSDALLVGAEQQIHSGRSDRRIVLIHHSAHHIHELGDRVRELIGLDLTRIRIHGILERDIGTTVGGIGAQREMDGIEIGAGLDHIQIVDEEVLVVLRQSIVGADAETLLRSTTTIVEDDPQGIVLVLPGRLVVQIDSIDDGIDDILLGSAPSCRLQRILDSLGPQHDRSVALSNSSLLAGASIGIQRITISIRFLGLGIGRMSNHGQVGQASIIRNNTLTKKLGTGIDSHSSLQKRLAVAAKVNNVVDSIHIKPVLARKQSPTFLSLIRGDYRGEHRHCPHGTDLWYGSNGT